MGPRLGVSDHCLLDLIPDFKGILPKLSLLLNYLVIRSELGAPGSRLLCLRGCNAPELQLTFICFFCSGYVTAH